MNCPPGEVWQCMCKCKCKMCVHVCAGVEVLVCSEIGFRKSLEAYAVVVGEEAVPGGVQWGR